MRRLMLSIPLLALSAATAFAQTPATKAAAKPAAAKQSAAGAKKEQLVEFEMMTWPEVKAALAAGKTTAIVYTGGTEQRGPQNVNGGHTLMARATAKAIALKLGNAIVMPTLAYSPNRASADLPGTIGLSNEVFGQMLTEISEQAIITGFKNVMIMGDHGGGQPTVFAEVAKKLDAKYSPEGKHVYFVDEVYAKAQGDFDDGLVAHGYPRSSQAGIPDTSKMLYLGGDKGWVRKELIATAIGDPIRQPGEAPDPNARPLNNGITGDGRKATAELGKRLFDMKVNYAVNQILRLLDRPKPAASQP